MKTVDDLIKELQKFNPDLPVVLRDMDADIIHDWFLVIPEPEEVDENDNLLPYERVKLSF